MSLDMYSILRLRLQEYSSKMAIEKIKLRNVDNLGIYKVRHCNSMKEFYKS